MNRANTLKTGKAWLILCLMGGMMTFVRCAFAHEGHEHSLQEMTMHIHSHPPTSGDPGYSLERKAKKTSAGDEIIQQKSEESIVRSEEYIKLTRDKTDIHGK